MNVTNATCREHGVYEFTLTADAAAFETALQAAYEGKKATYALDGYETGSVPRAAMEEKEGVAFLYYDAVNALLGGGDADATLEAAFANEGITPLTPPEFDVTACDANGVTVTLTVGVLPEVTLGAYKDITLEYPRVGVPDNAIDNQLEIMRHRAAAQQGQGAPLPELDDAFAKEAGCETMADLRTKMEESLEGFIKQQSYQQGVYMLLEEIGQKATMEVPEYLIAFEHKNGLKALEQHLIQNRIPMSVYLQQIGKTKEEFEAEHRIGATRALRGKLAAYTIAKAENITATEKAVESETVRLAAGYKKTVAAFKAENPTYIVRNELVLGRTLGTIAKANNLVEKA